MGELTDEKLLVVHGMKDAQVDVVQSWTLAQALIGRGILFTQMVRLSSFKIELPDPTSPPRPHTRTQHLLILVLLATNF